MNILKMNINNDNNIVTGFGIYTSCHYIEEMVPAGIEQTCESYILKYLFSIAKFTDNVVWVRE
jgi:hypothetical protein